MTPRPKGTLHGRTRAPKARRTVARQGKMNENILVSGGKCHDFHIFLLSLPIRTLLTS
jgi:hypothetical protein